MAASALVGIVAAMAFVFCVSLISHFVLSKNRMVAVAEDALRTNAIVVSETHEAFSECAIMTMELLRRETAIRDVLDTRFAHDFRVHPCEYLRLRLFGGAPADMRFDEGATVSYINYPLGSRHLEAIVLSIMSYSKAKFLYGLVSYAAVLAMLLAAVMRSPATVLLFAPLIVVLLFAFSLDRLGPHLAHAPAMFTAFLGTAVLIYAQGALRSLATRAAFLGFLATCIAYFDLLNGGMLVGLGVCIIANHLFYVRPRQASLRRALGEAAVVVACFAAAYVVLTVTRLSVLSAMGGINWHAYRDALMIRLGSRVGDEQTSVSGMVLGLWTWRFQMTYGSAAAAGALMFAGLAAWIAALGALPSLWHRHHGNAGTDIAIFGLVAAGSVGWHFVFENHTTIHPWLMVRTLAIPIACAFMAVVSVLSTSQSSKTVALRV